MKSYSAAGLEREGSQSVPMLREASCEAVEELNVDKTNIFRDLVRITLWLNLAVFGVKVKFLSSFEM